MMEISTTATAVAKPVKLKPAIRVPDRLLSALLIVAMGFLIQVKHAMTATL
jgi:hypothetical protein